MKEQTQNYIVKTKFTVYPKCGQTALLAEVKIALLLICVDDIHRVAHSLSVTLQSVTTNGERFAGLNFLGFHPM